MKRTIEVDFDIDGMDHGELVDLVVEIFTTKISGEEVADAIVAVWLPAEAVKIADLIKKKATTGGN